MENKQYCHKRTGIVVEWKKGSKTYSGSNQNATYYLAKEMVEGSPDWEEIVPLYDEHGVKLNDGDHFYTVHLLSSGITLLVNGRRSGYNSSKILAVYRDYKEACEYEKVYNALRKVQDCIVTPSGLPSAFFKKIIKQLHENKK
jgi:hypothetical protein